MLCNHAQDIVLSSGKVSHGTVSGAYCHKCKFDVCNRNLSMMIEVRIERSVDTFSDRKLVGVPLESIKSSAYALMLLLIGRCKYINVVTNRQMQIH